MFHRPKRFIAVALVSAFCLSSLPPTSATPPPSKLEESEVKEKGLLDGVINNVIKGKKICLVSGLCVNTNELTEALLAKQIRELAEKNAPVTASSNNLFPTVSSLPKEPFAPALLDLNGAKPDEAIPAGDYVIPVKFYCLQKPAASPPGHRYVLGQYGGKQKAVLAALSRASATSSASYNELQALSWAIQAGVAYDDMPKEMQALVDNLIPDHRSALKRGWLEDIEKVWNTGNQVLNLPSFDSFLVSNLGEVGRGIVAFREVRNRLINRGRDWRNLSDIFIIQDGTQGAGNILNTPWSQLSKDVYARFITEGNAGDTGLLLLRIEEGDSEKTKLLPLLGLAARGGLAVYELTDLVSTLMALPEGGQNIQPGKLVFDLAANVAGGGAFKLGAKLWKNLPKVRARNPKGTRSNTASGSGNQQGNPNNPGNSKPPTINRPGAAGIPNAQILSNAGQGLDRNGLTSAGRAFQKHGTRHPQRWGQPSGKASQMNESGQKILDEIVNSPNTQWRTQYSKTLKQNTIDGRLPDGRGARWSEDGKKFIGFLDP